MLMESINYGDIVRLTSPKETYGCLEYGKEYTVTGKGYSGLIPYINLQEAPGNFFPSKFIHADAVKEKSC